MPANSGSQHDGLRRLYRFDSIEGALSTVHVLSAAGPATIAVAPPPGGDILVEFTVSSGEDVRAGDALFVPASGLAEGGLVSMGATMDAIPSTVTAIRCTASSPGARVEVAQ